jgi:tetratricopeptide (TPR) repeat protein
LEVRVSSGFAAMTRTLMAQHGLSLRELARRIPIGAGHLSRVLNGHRTANDVIARGCDAVFGTGDLLTQAARADRLAPGQTPEAVPPLGSPVDWPGGSGLDLRLGSQLVDAYQALAGGQPSAMALDGVEALVGWLHHHYAVLPPSVLMPPLVEQTRLLTQALRAPLRIADRARVCAALGEIAGLRAWLMFDLGDLPASCAWFALAHRAAEEAGARDLTGWLYGAQSLQPSYAGDHRTALDLLERGIGALADPAGSRVAGWLHASAARSYAALGADREFQRSWDAATAAANVGAVRHSMDMADGHLDIGYYGGGALLALRQPAKAREVLEPSLAALPAARVKARTVLHLAIAVSHTQDRNADKALEVTLDALSLPADQCIDPIVRRAGDVRAELARLGAAQAVHRLDEKLADLTRQAARALPSGPGA